MVVFGIGVMSVCGLWLGVRCLGLRAGGLRVCCLGNVWLGWGWACSLYKFVHFTLCVVAVLFASWILGFFVTGVAVWLVLLVLWCGCYFGCFCWVAVVCGFALVPFCSVLWLCQCFANCCAHGLGAFKGCW